jgi:AcrR family transcriptional regulator
MSKQTSAQADQRDQQASGSWQWGSTPKTRRALLDAARQVFTEQGFSQTSVADVVERAGSSVGSLYHHFGGKSELFLALWHEHQRTHEEAASKAVARLRTAGVTDTTELFCVGARAFMEGSWLRRDLALLFFSGDGPPDFEVMKRRRGREWVAQNDILLGLPDTEMDRLYAAMLTSLIGEGARQVASAPNRREANLITEAVLEYARRLLSGGPCQRPNRPPLDNRPALSFDQK